MSLQVLREDALLSELSCWLSILLVLVSMLVSIHAPSQDIVMLDALLMLDSLGHFGMKLC